MTEKTVGVIDKYTVTRNNDEAGKHHECWFFVLDIEHDPIARKALMAYAIAACDAGNERLHDELCHRLARLNVEEAR